MNEIEPCLPRVEVLQRQNTTGPTGCQAGQNLIPTRQVIKLTLDFVAAFYWIAHGYTSEESREPARK